MDKQTDNALLSVRGAGFAYPGGAWLFRALNATVAPGDMLAVLGPNGRGKSTLLRCCAGLLALREGSAAKTAAFGYVPQSSELSLSYNVLDVVLMGRFRRIGPFALPSREDTQAAYAALEKVGLAHLAQRAFFSLSGGEKQLALIARALASEGTLLILDEPAAALDLKNQLRVLSLLKSLAAERMGIIFTTHNLEHAQFAATRALLLYEDAGHREGPCEQMLTEENISALYGVSLRKVEYVQDGTTRAVFTSFF